MEFCHVTNNVQRPGTRLLLLDLIVKLSNQNSHQRMLEKTIKQSSITKRAEIYVKPTRIIQFAIGQTKLNHQLAASTESQRSEIL